MMIIPFVFLGLALSAGMGCGNSAAPNPSTVQHFSSSTVQPYGVCAHLPRHDADFRERECNATDWSIRDIAFERCRFSSLRPAIFRGDAERHPENVVFRDCSRVHLDRLAIRHHPGYGGGRPDAFLEIEGVADVRLEQR